MNTARLIWGIVLLALAGLLAVLNFVLPEDSMMFTVGDANLPLLPPVILGVIGIILLATAFRMDESQESSAEKPQNPVDANKAALNKRLESIAWGAFLIMLGGFAFISDAIVDRGWWSIGVGLIMLGLNAARYMNQIRMSGFTTFLGIISLVGGVLELMGVEALEGGVLLIVLGAYLILKPWFDKRQVFGKAEES